MSVAPFLYLGKDALGWSQVSLSIPQEGRDIRQAEREVDIMEKEKAFFFVRVCGCKMLLAFST